MIKSVLCCTLSLFSVLSVFAQPLQPLTRNTGTYDRTTPIMAFETPGFDHPAIALASAPTLIPTLSNTRTFVLTFAHSPAIAPQPFTPDKARIMDYFQNQQFEEAIAYLSPALSADSNNIALLSYAGYAYYMTENPRAAAAAYQRIYDLDSVNVPALRYLVLLNQNDDHDKAMAFTARLISLQPNKAAWWRTMGELFRRQQQPDSGVLYLSRAYDLSPTDPKNISDLADVLIELKQYPRADSILDAGLEKDSLNLNFLKLRVRSAYATQDYAAVLIPGERLIRLDQPILNSLTWLALSYYNLKQYPDCIRVCEYMIGRELDVESIYYYEARAWAKLKDYTKSNALLSICLTKAISQTADWYYYDMGENNEGLKNYRQAVSDYDTAYYLFKDAAMLYNCGRICESELHNIPLARKYYTRYLAAAHPQSASEKKAYAYVRYRWGAKTAHSTNPAKPVKSATPASSMPSTKPATTVSSANPATPATNAPPGKSAAAH